METIHTRCCIAGGGPAGIMLGYLLARAGVDVVVLEKWPDFFRDFRGDTIHPSTMDILYELGLLDDFLKLPHNETHQMVGNIGGEQIVMADFDRLKVRAPYIAFIPQWDFLNFLTEKAKAFPTFHVLMETEAVDVLTEGRRTIGVRAKNKDGEFDITAELVVGTDGRHSTIREKAGLTVINSGAPIDVLWFRLPRQDDGTKNSFGHIDAGKFFVMLDRDTYWQCGYIIEKGGFDHIKHAGIAAFQKSIADLVPALAPSVKELQDFEHVKLLSVAVDHLQTWHKPGLICIGDSAHAMSPVGGVGINYAIHDAVAAANVLVPAFRRGIPFEEDLAKIQYKREKPARKMQKFQVFMHRHVLAPVLRKSGHITFPWILKIAGRMPFLRYIPARIIGLGFSPEHVEIDF